MRKVLTLAACVATFALIAGVHGLAQAEDTPLGDPYPLTTCPISGEALGAMGDSVVVEHNGREVRLCCASCKKKFDKDADAILEKIDAQIKEQQAKNYPLKTCIMSGKELGANPVVEVIGNRAVEFCCAGCPGKFKEDVAANMAKLDAAIIAAEKPVNDGGKCPVSGEALGKDAVKKVYGTEVVAFCCGGCSKKFEQNFAASMKKLHESPKQS